jgi:hypothetical protein
MAAEMADVLRASRTARISLGEHFPVARVGLLDSRQRVMVATFCNLEDKRSSENSLKNHRAEHKERLILNWSGPCLNRLGSTLLKKLIGVRKQAESVQAGA